MTYAALHTHSQFSIDGVGTIEQWVDMAKAKGLYGLGITDHGNFGGALNLYYAGKAAEFPVVLGQEFYAVEDLNHDGYFHLTVWCKNEAGYSNLCYLSSLAFENAKDSSGHDRVGRHFKKKPRVTYQEIMDHGEGLIIGSGCFIGEMNHELLCSAYTEGDEKFVHYERAKNLISKFKNRFGDDFYLEIMPAVVRNDKRLGVDGVDNLQVQENHLILAAAKEFGVKYICSSDAHMPDKSMEIVQKVKMANYSRGKGEKWEYEYVYYLRDPKEYEKQWLKEVGGISKEEFEIGCANTREIVDKCKGLELDFSDKLPKLDYSRYPNCHKDMTSLEVTLAMLDYHNRIDQDNQEYTDRIKKELKVLYKNGVMDLLGYFLLLEDVCRYVRTNKLTIQGVARGSAGGSLLAYALGITDIDPIKHGLSFERFINMARIKGGTLPDIDLDFGDRDAVVDYIRSVFGHDKVASFGVIHTLKIKMAVKDVLRVLKPNMSSDVIDSYSAAVPWVDNEQSLDDQSIEKALNDSPKLSGFLNENPDVKNGILKSIGQMRQYGVHAAAVAISPMNINTFIPLAKKASDKYYYTQFSPEWCAKAGLIKYDILGLNTLNIINECLKLIKERGGPDINPWVDVPFDDKATLEEFQKVETDTIFQFNTDAIKDVLSGAKISEFNDLTVINTLVRPGTFDTGMHREWLRRKKDAKKIEYIHGSLEPVLKDTLGILLYQEQVMESLRVLANFTPEEADDIRRAIGKKKTDIIDRYKSVFIARSCEIHKDINNNKAEKIWELIEAFGRYSFNKSHAVAYTIIAFAQQYLKVHYPIEYWCAVLRKEDDNEAKRKLFCKIKDYMSGYDIAKSGEEFTIDGDKIIPPINSIKFIGHGIVKEIRRVLGTNITTFEEFCTRMNKVAIKKNVMINLIIGGLFDRMSGGRTIPELIGIYYDLCQGAKIKNNGEPNAARKEFEQRYLTISRDGFNHIKATLLPFNDVDLSNLILAEYKDRFANYADVPTYPENSPIWLLGLVLGTHSKRDRNGNAMFFADISNAGDVMSLTAMHKEAKVYRDAFQKGNILAIRGQVQRYKGKPVVLLRQAKEIKNEYEEAAE